MNQTDSVEDIALKMEHDRRLGLYWDEAKREYVVPIYNISAPTAGDAIRLALAHEARLREEARAADIYP